MRNRISSAAAGTGLALSGWLAILKAADLPCFGGCAPVIQSSFGSLLGLPVGLYGVVLWLGVFFAPPAARRGCLAALGAGSVVFIGVQIFLLKAFCPACVAHALAAWTALAAGERPRRGFAWAAVGAVLAATAASALLANRAPAIGRPALAAFTQAQPEALDWLGPRDARSPVLVLSLTCPACLDQLAALTRLDFSARPHGPGLYFKTDARDRGLTAVFVAGVLAQPGGRRDAFLGVATLVLAQRDLLLTDPARAAAALRGLLPSAAAREPEAVALLARQAAQLDAAQIKTTPFLLRPDGTASAFFKPGAAFP